MSRSGYSDECDGWALIRWRGAVNSAIKGTRGQKFLRELIDALDALPNKRLIADELEWRGEVCALGALGRAKGLDLPRMDTENYKELSTQFNIAEALAKEVMYLNDETSNYGCYAGGESYQVLENKVAEKRYGDMRAWALNNLVQESVK